MKKRTKVFITMLMMVLVLGFTVNAESFTLSQTSITMNTDDVTVIKVSEVKTAPKWSTSNAKVAAVDQNGRVTALKAGKAKITASIGSDTNTCDVKVVNASLKLNKTDAVLYTGTNKTTLKLKANVKGLTKDVTYKSTNPDVATVSADGTITPVSPGQVKIIATANGQTTSCHVSVLKNRISLNVSSMVVSTKGAGASVKVKANVVGPKNKVKWTTSDKSVAAVSNGTVKGKGEGTAVITAEANGVKASCSVTVQPGFIAINEKQVTLYTDKPANAKKQLKSSATKKDSVVWASTNESVAKVDSKGLVTAVGAGTAYITLR